MYSVYKSFSLFGSRVRVGSGLSASQALLLSKAICRLNPGALAWIERKDI